MWIINYLLMLLLFKPRCWKLEVQRKRKRLSPSIIKKNKMGPTEGKGTENFANFSNSMQFGQILTNLTVESPPPENLQSVNLFCRNHLASPIHEGNHQRFGYNRLACQKGKER